MLPPKHPPDEESLPFQDDEPSLGEILAEPFDDPRLTLGQKIYAAAAFYPTIAWNVLLGRILKVRRWWDFIDDHVIVGARPFDRDIPELHNLGVRGVVNTCREFAGPVMLYDRFGIEQLYIPTTDFTHPRLADIVDAVAFVQRHVEAKHIVYIHCKAGRARSATVALCWLIAHRGLSLQEAQQLLLQKRAHINPRLSERPVVQAFVRTLQ